MKKRTRFFINVFLTAVICFSVIFAGVLGCAGGCGGTYGNYEFYFSDSRMGMFIGDEKEFSSSDFMFEPSAPGNFSFTLSSSDTTVLSVSGLSVYTRSEGVATLTATDTRGKNAECVVEVTSEITSFELYASTRSRHVGENREIEIYAVINDGSVSASNYAVNWKINNVKSNYTGSVYTLLPASAPVTRTVSASVTSRDGKTFTDDITVNWADAFVSSPVMNLVSGLREQSYGAVSQVVYALDYDLGSGNSSPVIEWFADGVKAQEGGDEFIFVPDSPGIHEITATVNGVAAASDAGKVYVSGPVVPKNLKIDFDTYWPNVMVDWSAASDNEKFTVSVTNLSDKTEKTYETVGAGLILTREQMDLLSSAYSVKVKSLGDGGVFTESQYCDAVSVGRLEAAAESYLERKWLGGNYYISSDEEFYAIYDYFLLYREQPVSEATVASYDVYMGYENTYTTNRLSEIAFNRAGYTGSYEIEASRRGNVISLSFKFYTVSTPDKKHSVSKSSSVALNGIVPHISATGRGEDYVPAIESIEKTVEVSSTDQLYRAAENGYRPLPKAGTSAYECYEYAKRLLNSILDEDMSDLEKAHAIYDWIMWRVLYDDSAANITVISEAVRYESFYLESVLTDTDYLSVCDGMSKAYSLLCNMEGIPCLRITGTARTGLSYGGHAWNKVMIDGKWYIVDCTWGDMQVSVKYKKGTYFDPTITVRNCELAGHMYFLKTDAEMSATHVEDEDTSYPRTAAVPYNIYAETRYDFGDIGFSGYVCDASALEDYADALTSFAKEKLVAGELENSGIGGPVFAFEIMIAQSSLNSIKPILTSLDKNRNPLISEALAKDLYYNLYAVDNYVVVILSTSVRLA